VTHDVSDSTYRELFSQLVTGGARLDAFLVQFWSLYSSDDRVDDDERYDILPRVFYAMEDYDPTPSCRSRTASTQIRRGLPWRRRSMT